MNIALNRDEDGFEHPGYFPKGTATAVIRPRALILTQTPKARQLREENGRLKRIVADLTMDRQILQEIVSKKL
jgi:hypothetical protein